MPSYTMINNKTGEEKEMILSLAERDQFLSSGEWKQKLTTAAFVSQTGSTISKTSSGWKDLLGRIKKGSGKGNSINL